MGINKIKQMPSHSAKHIFRVNLAQIRSAVPEIFYTQTTNHRLSAPKTEPSAVHCVRYGNNLRAVSHSRLLTDGRPSNIILPLIGSDWTMRLEIQVSRKTFTVVSQVRNAGVVLPYHHHHSGKRRKGA